MAEISKTDLEAVIKHLEARCSDLKASSPLSTRDANQARILTKLINKLKKKTEYDNN
ncbi:MAG: hypothetical protein K2M69_08260 [Muribaculaceae bacterium]|nr:hypothetical protein [Muribaculaceae bacterium]